MAKDDMFKITYALLTELYACKKAHLQVLDEFRKEYNIVWEEITK